MAKKPIQIKKGRVVLSRRAAVAAKVTAKYGGNPNAWMTQFTGVGLSKLGCKTRKAFDKAVKQARTIYLSAPSRFSQAI